MFCLNIIIKSYLLFILLYVLYLFSIDCKLVTYLKKVIKLDSEHNKVHIILDI